MLQSLLNLYNKVFVHQLINLVGAAALFLYPVFYGFDSSYIIACVLGILFGNLVISGYYHRCLSHRSWVAPAWLSYIMQTLGAVFWMMPSRFWVAVHREHHKYSDTDKDPHGPYSSISKNIFLLYNKPKIKYLKLDVNNKFMKWQIKNYFKISILSMILFSLINAPVYFVAVGYIYSAQILVNIVGHFNGLRDLHFLSIFVGGELYHKKHHNKQNDPHFGLFDFPYYVMIKWLN